MILDTAGWSGEGDFTQKIIDALKLIEHISSIKVEDAPATRSEADYNFLSNEVFVRFEEVPRRQATRRLGIIPGSKVVYEKAATLAELALRLEAADGIGAADYSDDGMIQFLRTERIIPPYQTRGYKLVELVRIYENRG
jgi:hypothetical protein